MKKDFIHLLNDKNIFDDLLNSGIIALRVAVPENESYVSFFHHIVHDYLAARYVASVRAQDAKRTWSSAAFDVISLNQSSYDALELAAEHIAQQGEASELAKTLVLQAYDWSLRGTLQVIGRLNQLGRLDVLPENLLCAIYCLNIEKKFEPFPHSVTDTRRYFDKILPSQAKNAWENSGSITSLISYAQAQTCWQPVAGDDYWISWLDLFSRTSQRATISDLDNLAKDALFGWTSANVFRREGCLPTDENVLLAARLMYWSSRFDAVDERAGAILRWRIVHMLGRISGRENSKFLLKVACDDGGKGLYPEYEMTRYGALRSYVEATALGPATEVEESLGALVERVHAVVKGPEAHNKRVKGFLTRKNLLSEVPDGWDSNFERVRSAVISCSGDNT